MEQLTVKKINARLKDFGILVIDSQKAIFLTFSEDKISRQVFSEKEDTKSEKYFNFRKGSVRAISNKESRIEDGLKSEFFKDVIAAIKPSFNITFKKIVLMSTENDLHILKQCTSKAMHQVVEKVIHGNFTKLSQGKIIEKVIGELDN